MSTKNLILCFSSIRPKNFPKNKLSDRESNYLLSLKWLLKSLPDNWDVIYNDNTLKDLSEIENPSLRDLLSTIKFVSHNENHGELNKGAGEHDMCKKIFLNINNNDYEWVSYFTARHIIPNGGYFDNLESKYRTYDAVMSNPGFDYLNYHYSSPSNGLYNDMLFSMKSNIFLKFVESIDIHNLKNKHKNSENHLYEFINQNNINKIEIGSLGILRNDHQSYGWHLV